MCIGICKDMCRDDRESDEQDGDGDITHIDMCIDTASVQAWGGVFLSRMSDMSVPMPARLHINTGCSLQSYPRPKHVRSITPANEDDDDGAAAGDGDGAIFCINTGCSWSSAETMQRKLKPQSRPAG